MLARWGTRSSRRLSTTHPYPDGVSESPGFSRDFRQRFGASPSSMRSGGKIKAHHGERGPSMRASEGPTIQTVPNTASLPTGAHPRN